MNKQQLIDEYEVSDLKRVEMQMYKNSKPWVKFDVPNVKDKHQGGRLDNWYGIYYEGELFRVVGNIFNDHRWREGCIIETSYVVNLEYNADTQTGILETRNTVYTLGATNKTWG